MRITRVGEIEFLKSEPCVFVCAILIVCMWIIWTTEECTEKCLRIQ